MDNRIRSLPPSNRRANDGRSKAPNEEEELADNQPRDMEKPEVAPIQAAREHGRGRHADRPTEVPVKGWLDILFRTKQQITEDNLSIVAAGVAFYVFVAVVPALAVVIALYALIANAAEINAHIAALAEVVPNEAMPLLEEQLTRITSTPQTASISAVLGLLIAVYGASKAMKALIEGLNIAYDEIEQRGFVKLNLVAIVLTIGAIVGVILAVALLAVMPAVLARLHITQGTETVLNWLRWPVLIGGFVAALAVVYRYGPSRHDAKWRWVSPGALVAGFLWLLGSGLFSLYVSKFGSYDKTYGSLGAVVVFLLWLFISAFVVLIGAELNAEIERQTLEDTTDDPDKPLGQRGAEAADTVGPSRENMPPKKKKA